MFFIKSFSEIYITYIAIFFLLSLLGKSFLKIYFFAFYRKVKLPKYLFSTPSEIFYPIFGYFFLGNLLVVLNFFTPVVEKMKNDYFLGNGYFEFLRVKDFEYKQNPFKADYTGFGWILIKQGVFEKLKYPWFMPRLMKVNDSISEVTSEDVAFCIDARQAGFDIWVNPKVRVGHEKTLTI